MGLRIPALAAVLTLAACHSQGKTPIRVPPTAPTTTTASSSASTSTTVQTSGPRTVLSALGLNIRSQASKSAPIVRTVAQGATLTVLSHTDQGGGWFEVKGATVSGWITDNPNLSAEGTFLPYNSSAHGFAALYPNGWTYAETPPASVAFHPKTGGDSVVVTTAATVDQLAHGQAGYQQGYHAAVVVCGVTADLFTYTRVSAPAGAPGERYLAQVRLALDPQHALGIEANLADIGSLTTVRDILSSISFPFPQCEK